MRAQNRYRDILDLPCPAPCGRPRMPRGDRAAQFAPFAALVGYDAVIAEADRLTEPKALLSEDALDQLDRRQRRLIACLDQRPEITVTYFRRDARKPGGAYVTVAGRLKRAGGCDGALTLEDGLKIPLEDVFSLDSPLLGGDAE